MTKKKLILKKGTLVNGKKVTEKQRKFFTDMCSMEDGGVILPIADSGIHIKPENRGKFTATKKRTGKSTEELTHSKNPLTRKRAIFAQNAKKWKHEDGGEIATTPSQQYQGLNNSSSNKMMFPMEGDNIFRGLDNGQPVLLIDSTGKQKVLTGPQDTAMMKGTVKEKRIKAQKGKSLEPITVTNPNDPRLRAYNDSLKLYNSSVDTKKLFDSYSTNNDMNWETIVNKFNNIQKNIKNILPNAKPIKTEYLGEGKEVNWFKKPVQPVVYQKPEGIYNQFRERIGNNPPGFGGAVGVNQEQKDYPIVSRPKAQVKGTITPGTQEQIPEPQGQSVFGPSNGLIGYQTKTGFQPTLRRDHLSKANQADIDLLNNPEALNKYVSSAPRYDKGGNIKAQQGASVDWNSQWLNSPMAKKMNQGEQDFTGERLQALEQLPPVNRLSTKELSKLSGNKSKHLGVYDYNNHTVNVNSGIKDDDLLETVTTHEKSHASDRGGKLMSVEDKALTDSEGRALLNQARYEYQKAGVFDPFTQPFKSEYLKNNNNGIRNLKKNYSDEQITNMMNSVSSIDTKGNPIAKCGKSVKGKMKKAQQGLITQEEKDKALWQNRGIDGTQSTVPSIPGAASVQANPNYDPNQKPQFSDQGITEPIDTSKINTTYNTSNGKQVQNARSKNNHPSFGVGEAITAGIGMAQLLMGPEGPRRRIDNTLAYNPYPQGTGSQAIAAKGKSITAKSQGSGLTTYEGGNAPKMSENMFDGGTHLFTGDSHANGGITSSFNGTTFEAEGGEPFAKIDNKGVVFGNMENPLTGRTYKKDAKEIMKKEMKVQRYLDKGTELVNTKDPSDKFQILAFNSGTAMMKGAAAKQKQLADSKKHLADLQEAHLELVGEEPTAKNGKIIAQKGWSFQGTNTSSLDEKLKAFADLVSSKGYTGYSGAKSGVDNRMTKSGHPSRHTKGQALDMVFDTPDAYNTLLKDPDVASFAMKNGLTLINEYDPNIASKTGATGGHIHVGYDRGTATANQFRKDASTMYPGLKPGKGIPPSRNTSLSPVIGDSYTEVPQFTVPDFKVTDPTGILEHAKTTINSTKSKPYEFTKIIPDKITPTNDKLKLSQIMGEIPALFDAPDFVEGGHYNPDLYTPYQISFQDRINQNSKTFNALAPSLVNNAEAQSTLAGQLYSANDAVKAEEFRTNQAISNDITNKNVSLLNEAKLKNISLTDQKYVRQAQAKSITKENRQNALNSISSKILQKEASNNMLNVYKNLYPHYDFDKNFQVQKQGASGLDYVNFPTEVGQNPSNPDGTTTVNYDANGVKTGSKVVTEPSYKREKGFMDLEKLKKDLNNMKFNGSIVKKYKQF